MLLRGEANKGFPPPEMVPVERCLWDYGGPDDDVAGAGITFCHFTVCQH